VGVAGGTEGGGLGWADWETSWPGSSAVAVPAVRWLVAQLTGLAVYSPRCRSRQAYIRGGAHEPVGHVRAAPLGCAPRHVPSPMCRMTWAAAAPERRPSGACRDTRIRDRPAACLLFSFARLVQLSQASATLAACSARGTPPRGSARGRADTEMTRECLRQADMQPHHTPRTMHRRPPGAGAAPSARRLDRASGAATLETRDAMPPRWANGRASVQAAPSPPRAHRPRCPGCPLQSPLTPSTLSLQRTCSPHANNRPPASSPEASTARRHPPPLTARPRQSRPSLAHPRSPELGRSSQTTPTGRP